MIMSGAAPAEAGVPGLVRSDLRGPGITRARGQEGFRCLYPSGADVTDEQTLLRIGALAIPPAWKNVWISPDPLGHIQATGVDRRGRTQNPYHHLSREQPDALKFGPMLPFAGLATSLRTV